jgi:hypothetical protein
MSNPNKKWSWGIAFGRGTGSAVGAGLATATMTALGSGNIGIPLGAAIGASGGFIGGFLGVGFGHWLDDPPSTPDTFSSATLFTSMLSGFTTIIFLLLGTEKLSASPNPVLGLMMLSAFAGFLSSSVASVIDDFRARHENIEVLTDIEDMTNEMERYLNELRRDIIKKTSTKNAVEPEVEKLAVEMEQYLSELRSDVGKKIISNIAKERFNVITKKFLKLYR